MKLILTFLFFFFSFNSFSQSKHSTVTGIILDENNHPINNASITILGQNKGVLSNDSGKFTIKTPTEKPFALTFTHSGYFDFQKNFFLHHQEISSINIILKKNSKLLETVVISNDKERKETGLITLNSKNSLMLPSTSGGVEGLIKSLVGSNNELTSQYSVRGGNYDENIVYINDFEIYRPYLVSNGQQEGLSFINPQLVKNIHFYTGGFQANYGDKMSSVLDIQYKKPSTFEGTAYLSGIEQGLQFSGNIKKEKATYLLGLRNKNNKSVLSNQPTTGSYIPSASDIQSLIHLKLTNKTELELLGNYSVSRFTYIPESVKKTAGVFSPLFTANIGLDTYFEGQEKDDYNTYFTGATIIQSPTKKLKLKWLASHFNDIENENYDIAGTYIFGERDFDKSSSTFGEIINPLGAGTYRQYARNHLNISNWNFSHKGSLSFKNNFLQWGNGMDYVEITDLIKGFEYQDSAGYSLPYNQSSFNIFNSANSQIALKIKKYTGFIQDNKHFLQYNSDISIQAGIRYNYNDLNKELLVSPRIQISCKPSWKNDMLFKLAGGIYNQPPFYREFKKYNGELNTAIKSQKSMQFVAGMDYQFTDINGRPFKLTTEAYFKKMTDVIPYDIDNVKIKYLGENNAKAYAAGLELRLFGELIKDAESWLSVGFMKTRENLSNDYYYQFRNSSGEIITSNTVDQIAVDSVKQTIGYLRRPSDRLITVGLFMQDYLPTNKNFKVHFNLLYGSNMPYNIPNSTKYRNALTIKAYIRADIGFSALLLGETTFKRRHSPFNSFKNIWASFEVFNLIDKANTISYQLIKDFDNNIYALPNRLTPRMLNLKMIASF